MPFTVVLETAGSPEIITDRVSGLTFSSVSPGGYGGIEFDLPRALDADRLEAGHVWVYDVTTGEQVAGGRLLDQGQSDDGTWHVTCLGEGLAALQDIDEPYMVIDREPQTVSAPHQVGVKLARVSTAKRRARKKQRPGTIVRGYPQRNYRMVTDIVSAEARDGSPPNNTNAPGLLFQFPDGTTMNPGGGIMTEFSGPFQCGMRLGAFTYRYLCGAATSNWKVRARVRTSSGGTETVRDDNWVTSLTSHSWRVAGTHFSNGRDSLSLDVRYLGAEAETGRTAWAHVRELIVRAQLYAADGTLRSGASHVNQAVSAPEVFTDLVVRRCPSLRVGTTESGSRTWTDLTWYDGTTAKEVLDELIEEDGTITYHAWAPDADGRTRINLARVPLTVRYEIVEHHGFKAPSPSSDVFTRVVVTGVNGDGSEARYVEDRTPAGGTARSQTIRLDGVWTAARVTAAAKLFLDNHAAPPNAGTVNVVSKVRDLRTGRYIEPYQMRAGELCRVQGVQPQPDSLNRDATQDGATIFRIITNTWRDEVSSLELDTSTLDPGRALAALLS